MRIAPLFGILLLILLVSCGGGGTGGGGTNGGNTNGGTTGGPDDKTAYVTGSVIIENFSVGIQGVSVYFTLDDGTVLNSGATDANGVFAVNVDPRATKIWIPKASYNSSVFYSSFLYKSVAYSASLSSCGARLPALSTNQTFPISPLSLVLRSDPPPPPPTGCSL